MPLPRIAVARHGLRLAAKENRSVVKTLVMFSAIMVAFPISTFFAFYEFILLGENVARQECPAELESTLSVVVYKWWMRCRLRTYYCCRYLSRSTTVHV